MFLQHFTGTLDNWDPAVTDQLALGREVILFESAGIGRSSGKVPETVAGMADHAMKFLNALGLTRVDVLGFSLGGMVAQGMALKRPALLRRIILTGTGPEGGVGVAMDGPELLKIFVHAVIAFAALPPAVRKGSAFPIADSFLRLRL